MSTPEPHRYWTGPNGRTASIYGAAPWGFGPNPGGWEIVAKGWTVAHPDGTLGLARVPFTSREDAQAWCDAHPHFPGMSQG